MYYCKFSGKLFHCVMIKLPEAGKWKKIASYYAVTGINNWFVSYSIIDKKNFVFGPLTSHKGYLWHFKNNLPLIG